MDDMEDWLDESIAYQNYLEIQGEHEGDIERDNTPVVRGITDIEQKKEEK